MAEKRVLIHNKSDRPDNVIQKENDIFLQCEAIERELPRFLRGFYAYLRSNVLPNTRLAYLHDIKFFMQYLIDETDKAELNPAALAACYDASGACYEYPLVMTAHCMAINKTVFEAAGAMQYIDEETHTWTTENFIKAVDAVYAHTNKTVGAVYCAGQGGDQGTRHMISNVAGGTAWSNPEPTKFTVAQQANAEALARLKAQDGVVFDPSIVGGDEFLLFLQGHLGMATCWNATLHGNNADIIAANEWELFPMAFPHDETPVLAGGFYCLGIFDNKDDAKDEAANLFIEFIGSDEIYKEAVLAAGQWATRDIGNIYEGDELMTQVREALTDEFRVIADIAADVAEVNPDATVSKTTYRLTKLVEANVAEKTQVSVPAVDGGKTRKVQAYRLITQD